MLDRGAGKDVIFLHGYMSCKESFYYNTGEFARAFRVVAPDMPGFGASAPLEEEWSVGDYAAWLEKFIAECAADRPHVVAHSFGARVAIKLASLRPGIFERMVLVGGAGLVKPRSRSYKIKVAAYRAAKKFAPAFAEKRFGSREYRSLPPVMRGSYKKIVNEDLLCCAKKIELPVLLVYGRDDKVTPACEEGAAFRAAIARSRLEVIEGGHFCFSENHLQFNKLAAAFLSGGATET